MQREEAVTPGVWPRECTHGVRSSSSAAQKANYPLATIADAGTSPSATATAEPAAMRPAANDAEARGSSSAAPAVPAASSTGGSSVLGSLSRFRQARRVVSENIDASVARDAAARSQGGGGGSVAPAAATPSATDYVSRIAAINPLTNRLSRTNSTGNQVSLGSGV
jgi:hypothetical protein